MNASDQKSKGESTMKRTLIAHACGAVFAVAAGSVLASPTPLGLDELDQVTASGSNPPPNGGAIVGNGSTANLASTGEVLISDGAQAEARAMNVVNSSESTVANGVNVFDGRVSDLAELDGAQFDVSQLNVIAQDQRRLSSLPSYERGANTQTVHTDAGSSSSDSSLALFDQVTSLERTVTTDQVTTEGGFEGSSSPTLLIDLSGDLTIGGSDPFFDGSGRYYAEFNMPSAKNSVGAVFNGGVDWGIDAGQIVVDTGDLGLLLEVNLPEVHLDIDAMGCIALNGACWIDASRTETFDEISDHSTLYTRDESSSSTSEWNQATSSTVQAPFTLKNGQAEYIVVDESHIDVTAAYLVNLSGGAQSGLRAMNAVNAAGSAVANGVNVATSRSGSLAIGGVPNYQLSQVNEISHSR